MLAPEPPTQVLSVIALTIIVGEADAEVRLLDLLQEDVLLVEEEDDRGGGEVAVVADAVEQLKAFMHSVLS